MCYKHRTATGTHVPYMGSHSVTCHPAEVTFSPTSRRFLRSASHSTEKKSLYPRRRYSRYVGIGLSAACVNKKHLKNVGPIRHSEPLHCHSPGVATVARRLRIDVHDDDDNNDNARQRGPLWPHRMGPMIYTDCMGLYGQLQQTAGSLFRRRLFYDPWAWGICQCLRC